MAHLTCIDHRKRVVVVASEDNQTATVFHRNVTGNESVRCDSFHVVIDGDAYAPEDVLDFGKPDYVENFLLGKYDQRIYA